MAAPGRGLAVPLDIDGYDPYRAYTEEPQAGGWRELRNPIGGQRYWNHVSMRITTWSLVELLRLNGLEEFLLLGEWGVFVAVPESKGTYEDRDWGLPLFEDDQCSGRAVGKLPRGTVFASLGFPRPGVLEVLLPDPAAVVVRRFTLMRSGGLRLVQRLPVREHNDDLAGVAAVTVPMFRVRPEDDGEAAGSSALIVTAERDPRSTELGYVRAGTKVGLATIVGTRAQLARVPDGQTSLWGGWISFLLLDGTPTLERVMEDTANMKLAEELKAEMARIDALRAAAIANGEDPEGLGPQRRSSAESPSKLLPPRSEATARPPLRSKRPVDIGPAQRATVTGGWRMHVDRAWTRPVYVAPIAGRMTWGLTEVLSSGGLDDLLLARSWELCVVDPMAAEAMKDKDWTMKVFSDASMSGQPVRLLAKGTVVVCMVFHAPSKVAMVLLPPRAGEECGIGYAFYQQRDGRPVLRAMLPPAPLDENAPEGPDDLPSAAKGYAEPPEGELLEGPYFAEPEGQSDLTVTVGQDIGSDRWARLPRGYRVSAFAELLGFRARLSDLEGGGWVSLVSANGSPNFRKQPLIPTLMELPGQDAVNDEEDAKLPIVWPHLGVIWPEKPKHITPVSESTLPELLYRLGGSRALCDWNRVSLPPSEKLIWRNAFTGSQSHLDEILRSELWKIAFVEVPDLAIRERMDPRSRQLTTLRHGALVIAEWVAPGACVRVLLPGRPEDPRPQHAWADLAAERGATLSPLSPGGDFWVEPKGGHLPDVEQTEAETGTSMKLFLRESPDLDAPSTGFLQRGDGVQIAELRGRRARLVHTKCIVRVDTAPQGGWADIFDESGWPVLRGRWPEDVHPREVELQRLAEIEESYKPKALGKSTSPKRAFGTPAGSPTAAGGVACEGEDLDRQEEDGAITEADSEEALELPALLWQLGELEAKSVWTRDWRECVDPVWGQRYFVNRWSGQIIHRLSSMGVACPAVRLTVQYSNLSFAGLMEVGAGVERRVAALEQSLLPSVAALADVDEDRVELHVEDADSGGSLADGSVGPDSSNGFRVIAVIRAPGARSSWASAALKVAMADSTRFTSQMVVMISSTPDFYAMRVDPYGDVALVRADLEELDIPRVARAFEPPPPPPPVPPLPVAAEFEEIRKSYAFTRQKVLHYHCKPLGLGDSQALAGGLEAALPVKPLEELGMWGCGVGDGGACSLAKALSAGCGSNLLTLLLDENGITPAGATALGVGLAACTRLRELGVSRNPIGIGFAKLLSGLGEDLVVLDASEADIDDSGAFAAAACFPRWPALRSLRLRGNKHVGPLGVEAVARALLGAPTVKLADLLGADDGGEWPRLSRVLQDGGVDPSRMRIKR